jgi:hypothetical protein
LGLREFLVESIDKAAQNITRVADFLSILTHNPYQCSSSVRLIKLVNALAQSRDDAFVARVLSEDILDDDDSLLNDIVDLGVYQVQQRVHTLLASALDLDSNLANGLDSTADKVHVHLKSVFLQLGQELVNVAVVGYPHHNFQLLEFDICRIVILAEEHTEFLVEDIRLLLQQKINVSQSHILHLRGRRYKRDCYGLVKS